MSNRLGNRAVPRPLFHLSDRNLEVMYVSNHSMWRDKMWRFDNSTGGARQSTINWETGFETCWSDPACQYLVDQGRRLIDAMRNISGSMKDSTICDQGICLCYLLRWMYNNGYRDFSELSKDACDYYISDLVNEKIEIFDDSDNSIVLKTLAKYIDILKRIYNFAPRFSKLPYLIIPQDPLLGKSAFSIAKEYAVKEVNRIPAVPRQMYNPIVSSAQTWVELRSQDILCLQDRLIDARARVAHMRGNSKNYYVDKYLNGFSFDRAEELTEPWRPQLNGRQIERRCVNSELLEVSRSPSQQVRSLVSDLTMAAYICIQAGTGIRVSEMAGLCALPYREDGLPNCVDIRPSLSGLFEVFYIRGWVYKTVGKTQKRVAVDWVAGARPVGTSWLPFTIRALVVLDKLYSPWREMFESEALVVSLPSAGLPQTRRGISKILSRTILDGQNSFIKRHVDLPPEFLNWRLTTHQWRKRFAQDLISYDPELLKAVSEHFLHLSEVITEQAYGGDAMLRRTIDSTAVRDAASMFHDAIYGRATIGGKSTGRIFDYEPWIREKLDSEMSKDAQIDILVDILREDNVRLFDSEYGGCLFRSNTARCHHECHGVFDFLATRPLGTYRRPQLCGTCSNLIIAKKHIAFWRNRYAENLQIFEMNDAPENLAIRVIAKERMLLAKGILLRMDKTSEGHFQ